MKRKSLLTMIVFLLMIVFLYYEISSIQQTSDEKQLENLQNSIRRSAVQCYALEGRYPESLDYLKKYYGIDYDEKKYFVDYTAQSSNLMPDITVLKR